MDDWDYGEEMYFGSCYDIISIKKTKAMCKEERQN